MNNADDAKDKEDPVKNKTEPTGQNEKTDEVKNNKDESDEDVPGDFFDDFLKEDFMAGLDIVDDDEWDEDKAKCDAEAVGKSEENIDTSLDKHTIENLKKRKKRSIKNEDVNKSPTEQKERHNKQKKKRHEGKEVDPKYKRCSEKRIDADEFDIRRDPEKTKRDIARDKVRCEKDKEMKIISEKLSLVETGLVPPGTEMEIDIEEVKRQKERIENKSPRDLREHIKDLKERNRSPGYRPRSPPKRRSPLRKSPNSKKMSPSRRRSRSPRRDPLTLVRSDMSPTRRSPRRSPFRRTSPLRHRSSERIYSRRRSRSHSPYYRNRRDKYSPHRHRDRSTSRESDREKWLKRRNRSRSPRRKRDEKKSFLQEIAEKLNEIRHPVNILPPLQPMPPMQPILQPMQPTLRYVQPQPLPVPVPPPAPVPPPNTGPIFPESQQQPQYDPYDQNFFIGTPQPTTPNSFSCQPQPSPLPPGPQMPLNPVSVQSMTLPRVTPSNLTSNSMNISSAGTEKKPQNQLIQKPEKQEDIAKLFQDKQITLSEFLAITAKPEVFSSSPTHLQEKIKVITRCHDAIKILAASEKKYSGRLVVHKTNKYNAPAGKNISPLKSAPPVQFKFTNPMISVEEQKSSFTNFINELLQKMGLLKDAVVSVEDEESSDLAANPDALPKFSPPPPPLITPIKNPIPIEQNTIRYNSFVDSGRFSKMVQTDIFKCETCEKRKKILHRSTAVQASDSPITFSVSTQVTEEDFQPKIPKTQSLAALTPAQLLAKSRESLNAATRGGRIDIDNFDIHPTGYNRPNFFRPTDNYNHNRPNQPFANSSSIYDALSSQMSGGGGRGREPNFPRTMDSNARFNHNSYY